MELESEATTSSTSPALADGDQSTQLQPDFTESEPPAIESADSSPATEVVNEPPREDASTSTTPSATPAATPVSTPVRPTSRSAIRSHQVEEVLLHSPFVANPTSLEDIFTTPTSSNRLRVKISAPPVASALYPRLHTTPVAGSRNTRPLTPTMPQPTSPNIHAISNTANDGVEAREKVEGAVVVNGEPNDVEGEGNAAALGDEQQTVTPSTTGEANTDTTTTTEPPLPQATPTTPPRPVTPATPVKTPNTVVVPASRHHTLPPAVTLSPPPSPSGEIMPIEEQVPASRKTEIIE
eukprot:TRINITY_DN12160_c0_g1_i1.p1 TRINITY_DN12160_c0_g1~~TRINITY_DN12160_c0_g1_i1.p1  ORF type:complete len:331 (-),score=73.36 TRINITY_DN12160_c0_g1_i1:310-1194(-)